MSTTLQLDPEAIRALQDKLLQTQVRRLRSRHPYYRRHLGDALGNIHSVSDLASIPVTTKHDFSADPDAFRLETDHPVDVLWDVGYTSGSTSTPLPIYQTGHDFRGILLLQQRMAQIRGISSEDTIANLYPLTAFPHGAWIRANHAAAAVGATLLVGMGGAPTHPYDVTRRTTEILAMLERSQPTVLWGVPSHLRKVLDRAAASGVSLRSIRLIAVSGEACPPAMAAKLIEVSAEVGSAGVIVSNSLGASELQGGLVECQPGSGFHNPVPELYFFEAVDADGHQVPAGELGTLAVTHLDRTGTAFLRYALGDTVRYTEEPCRHCGRSGGRVISHEGRSGSMTKVRGNLFDVSVLSGLLEHLLGDDYQVVIAPELAGDPLSADVLTIRIADLTQAELVREGVKRTIGITPRVSHLKNALDGTEGTLKPKRFIDTRNRELA